MLGTSDVKVTTGAGAVGISIASPLSWGSSNRLTLGAKHSVTIRSKVIVEGTGGFTITIDEGAAGALNLYPQGSVTFWDTTSSLVINGNAYTLVNDIATLAAAITANPSGFYALAKDYDASADGTYTQAPIQTTFSGTMEGLNHVISNLTIAATATTTRTNIGLFARTDYGASIRDVGLENVQISAPSANRNNTGFVVGSVVAYLSFGYKGGGSVTNVYAHGSVTGGNFTGGLIGNMVTNTIRQSHCDCAVSGYGYVGGLVGVSSAGQIVNSYTSGTVTAAYSAYTQMVGGLLGWGTYINGGSDTAITGSHSTANISSVVAARVGGLVGVMHGAIGTSYATGTISAAGPSGYGGGLAGESDGAIADSHATGAVATTEQIALGGLVGWNQGTISRSFAAGSVTGSSGQCTLGGLVASNTGTIQVSYAKGSVSRPVANSQFGCIAGGLVSLNYGTIQVAYATGAISDAIGQSGLAGGLVGENQGSISNAYALGSVSSDSSAIVGGLVGTANSKGDLGISSAYSTGSVSGSPTDTGGSVGSFLSGAINDDYWDVVTSGTHRSAGGTGLRTYELKAGLPPGFDSAIWGQQRGINKGYPYLLALPPH